MFGMESALYKFQLLLLLLLLTLKLCPPMKYKTMNADATCSIAFLTSADFKCNN